MGNRLGRLALAIACGMSACGLAAARPVAASPPEPDTQAALIAPATGGYQTVAELKIGSGPGQVGIEHPPDGPAWGPASFDVTDDGTLYVLDGVNGAIHVVDRHGVYQRSIPFSEGITCPQDLDATSGGIFLLDLAAQPTAVHQIDEQGVRVRSWEIPGDLYEDGVTGLRARERAGAGSSATSVYLEIDGAWEVPFVTCGERCNAQRVPKVREGDVVDIPQRDRGGFAVGSDHGEARYGAIKDWETGRSASIETYRNGVPTARMCVETDAQLGAVRVLGGDGPGRIHVMAEEIDGSQIRTYVKSFDATGQACGIGELPLGEFATFPQRMARVTRSGDVLALVPGDAAIRVVRLDSRADRSPRLGAGAGRRGQGASNESAASEAGGAFSAAWAFIGSLFSPEEAHAIWTPLDAWTRGMEFINTKWYCNSANYYPNGVNVRPRYITGYNRWWTSVPYCWGGWDMRTAFTTAMSANLDAGDINTSTAGKQPSTAGTDCSGLVSRLWGLGHKRSTSTAAYWGLASTDISTYLGLPGKAGERLGDIYIDPGSHVMMVDYVTIGGARLFEATKTNSYDRVVHEIRAWSALPGYHVRRYNNWR